MHPPEVRAAALELINAGHNDCEVSRRLGIARTTVRDWRRPRYSVGEFTETCLRCWRRSRPMRFTSEDYSEFLGLYLGDGSISSYGRAFRFRLTLDRRYPGIISDAVALLTRTFPANRVDVVKRREGCVDVSVYSAHLPCVLPQHGPGGKHRRPIELEPWQASILEDFPWPFIRGCIRTDGCSYINRTGKYEYLSYDFTNRSDDITGLFVDACERVGLRPRTNWSESDTVWRVRINRRACVTLMRDHVGLKS